MRSTFIVGFPGETEEEFEILLELIEEAELDRVGCFAYSPVEGAEANELPGAVPEELKTERWERLMEVAGATISAARLPAKVGRSMEVLVDEVGEDGAVARSHADAPEIDGLVYVADASEAQPGEFIQVEVTEADEHDLWARLAD